MSMPLGLYGFCAKLCDSLTVNGTTLPIKTEDAALLCTAAEGLQFSYVLQQDARREIIKITCTTDNQLVALRGQEGTTPMTFTTGAILRFDWTPDNLNYALSCAQEDDGTTVCNVTSTTLDVSRNPDKDCEVVIDLKSDVDAASQTWRSCGREYVFANGAITSTELAASERLTPGTYENATVTIGDCGSVTAVVTGTNIVHKSCVSCGGCNCDKTESV